MYLVNKVFKLRNLELNWVYLVILNICSYLCFGIYMYNYSINFQLKWNEWIKINNICINVLNCINKLFIVIVMVIDKIKSCCF